MFCSIDVLLSPRNLGYNFFRQRIHIHSIDGKMFQNPHKTTELHLPLTLQNGIVLPERWGRLRR
jgi:hypothetical protein